MTAEERAALIDRMAPLIIEERRKAAEQNPKRPPWYTPHEFQMRQDSYHREAQAE